MSDRYQGKRLVVRTTVFYSEKDKAVATIKKIQDHFGLEPLAAAKNTGTGLNLIFVGSKGDRLIHAFIELLPKSIVDMMNRDIHGHGASHHRADGHTSWEFRLDKKSDANVAFDVLGAPDKLKSALKKAKVSSYEEFVDSSGLREGDASVVTRTRSKKSNVSAEWDAVIEGVNIHVRLSPAEHHNGYGRAVLFAFSLTYDFSARRSDCIRDFSDAGFDIFEGEVEG